MIIEVAAFTPGSALVAAGAGADRVELCSGFSEGGLSPSAGSVWHVLRHCKIPVHVMIRPRVGAFIYTDTEKQAMLEDVRFCREAGASAVVVGALMPDGTIDKDFIRQVVGQAFPMTVTFHRAFDLCTELFSSLDALVLCGVKRVLTSGGAATAPEAAGTIRELVEYAGNRMGILPGGGIHAGNALEFARQTGVKELHFSAKEMVYSTLSRKSGFSLSQSGLVDDSRWYECSRERVEEMRRLFQK
jgi:copper homeostasis protein